MVKNFVDEPANSSSTLNKEADRISEMLVPVYKLLRRLVPRIPQYFNCRRNFRYYKGMSQGKLPLITDRQTVREIDVPYRQILCSSPRS